MDNTAAINDDASERFSRSIKLWGKAKQSLLADSHVALFGLGGVGAACCEALARAGIGKLTLIDSDTVQRSNINRQILATETQLGRPKTDSARERIADINPLCQVQTHNLYFDENTASTPDFHSFDFVVDAIDSVASKLLLAQLCQNAGTPLIASMGTGNKLDASALCISTLYKTEVCPLARALRTRAKKAGLQDYAVVYSREELTIKTADTPASNSYVPPVAGYLLAQFVIRTLLDI